MASTDGSRATSKSPQTSNKNSPPRQEPQSDSKTEAAVKPEPSTTTTADASKPLAPPPRPAQQQGTNTPDYFNSHLGGSLSLEPNPFEQSFGAPPETPGGTKLPSVASLTSPSSLLPGTGVTPFTWGGGSLRTGPLSPAMLSGPTNDYFGDTHHIRGGFPTPNESSMRTGLTPGGSGSMFPAPSPNSQALFASLSTAATPGTIDFHRTAMSAAAAKSREQQALAQPNVTSQPQEMANGTSTVKPESKPPTGPFDPHDNDAANGLFMLAQGRNNTQPPNNNYAVQPPQHTAPKANARAQPQPSTSPQMNGHSIAASSTRGISEAASAMSDESEQQARPTTRGRGKRNSTANGGTTNGRRKAADDAPKPPAKKSRVNGGGSISSGAGDMDMMDHSDDENMNMKDEHGNPKTKMTDEEKRKNFLERNRVAALKCRQRKKQWLANLQNKVELFSSENDALTTQITQLREEVVNLKTLLLAHKDCPVTQQQGLHGAFFQEQSMQPFNPQMNPYGMGAPIPQQPVMAGQGGPRRFS
ncbi:bZIP transcription factor [Coniochaeta sp. 2T2.1]|nr:bZIP transcription factor [Coniochaeta sp. 2T2.1]